MSTILFKPLSFFLLHLRNLSPLPLTAELPALLHGSIHTVG